MQYQAVVFDMDGVIFDTERLVIEFWKEVAKKHNIPNVEHTCIQCLGTNRVRTREIFLENYGADFPFDPYRAEVTELFNTHYKGVPLPTKPGVRELLSYLQEQDIVPERRIYQHISVFEEVGHGCSYLPAPVSEVLAVDMGCVGEGLNCTERQVSICAKDSHGPYHYATVSALVAAAEEQGIDFAIDIYPHYGSDADAALDAGYDIRHALIGAGVYASHGYERSHIEGVRNTFELLKAYLD